MLLICYQDWQQIEKDLKLHLLQLYIFYFALEVTLEVFLYIYWLMMLCT